MVLVDEHHAIERELRLGQLAQRGSDRVAELGRDLVRDMGFADDQVQAFAQMRRPMLARYQGQAAWLAPRFQPAT